MPPLQLRPRSQFFKKFLNLYELQSVDQFVKLFLRIQKEHCKYSLACVIAIKYLCPAFKPFMSNTGPYGAGNLKALLLLCSFSSPISQTFREHWLPWWIIYRLHVHVLLF